MLWRVAGGSILLFALNAFICWELFVTEYTRHMGSIEAAYIGLSRWILEHPGDLDWFPLWYTGVPFQNTYPPLLHAVVAGVAGLGGISTALAHHATTAFLFSLGPVTLFWCGAGLSRGLGETSPREAGIGSWATPLAAGIGYSLFSPSMLQLGYLRAGPAGMWGSARLTNLVQFGEGPHIAALTLLPLALLALDWALRKPSAGRVYLAAIAMAAVVLTNWIGAFALALIVVVYLMARIGDRGDRSWWRTAGIAMGTGAIGYGLAAPWIPPSTLKAISYNAQNTVGTYPVTWGRGAIVGALLLVAALLIWVLRKTRLPLIGRVSAVLTLIFAALVASEIPFEYSLIPQGARYHTEMEIFAWLFLAFAGKLLLERLPARAFILLPTAGIVLFLVQANNHRRQARDLIQPIDIATTLEYKAARFLDETYPGERAYLAGSSSFWLTAFSGVPEIRGGFAQGIVNRSIPMVDFGITFTEENGEDTADWLRVYGTHAVVVSGAEGRDAFRDWQDPQKFDDVLPELWREGDDAIYAVLNPVLPELAEDSLETGESSTDLEPEAGGESAVLVEAAALEPSQDAAQSAAEPLDQRGWGQPYPQRASLAHMIRPDEVVRQTPVNFLDKEPLLPLIAALEDPDRPPVAFEWQSPSEAFISGELAPGELYYVQVAHHPGWKAYRDGLIAPITADPLGMIVIEPRCAGECEVRLVYDGGYEMILAYAAMWVAIIAGLIWVFLERMNRGRLEVAP